MESHNQDYMGPHLNTKRSRYAEKESERYVGDWMYFFFIINVFKDCSTNNKCFCIYFRFFVAPPPPPPHLPIAISVLAQCEEGEIDRITNISYLLPTEMM